MAGQWSSLLLLSRGIPDAPWWPAHTTSPGRRCGDQWRTTARCQRGSKEQAEDGEEEIPQHPSDSIVKVSRGRRYLSPAGRGIAERSPSTHHTRRSVPHGGRYPIAGPLWSLPPETRPPRGTTPLCLSCLRRDDPASRGSWSRRRRRPLTLCERPNMEILRLTSFQVSGSSPGRWDSC